jgi:hypothetical protein
LASTASRLEKLCREQTRAEGGGHTNSGFRRQYILGEEGEPSQRFNDRRPSVLDGERRRILNACLRLFE